MELLQFKPLQLHSDQQWLDREQYTGLGAFVHLFHLPSFGNSQENLENDCRLGISREESAILNHRTYALYADHPRFCSFTSAVTSFTSPQGSTSLTFPPPHYCTRFSIKIIIKFQHTHKVRSSVQKSVFSAPLLEGHLYVKSKWTVVTLRGHYEPQGPQVTLFYYYFVRDHKATSEDGCGAVKSKLSPGN